MCRTHAGCPIKDLATDAAVNGFIDRYRIARVLYDVNQIETLLLREFENLGLDKDSMFLLRLESIYRIYQNQNHARNNRPRHI